MLVDAESTGFSQFHARWLIRLLSTTAGVLVLKCVQIISCVVVMLLATATACVVLAAAAKTNVVASHGGQA